MTVFGEKVFKEMVKLNEVIRVKAGKGAGSKPGVEGTVKGGAWLEQRVRLGDSRRPGRNVGTSACVRL